MANTVLAGVVDSEAAIAKALMASKKHGAASPEVWAACNVVEEVDAANQYMYDLFLM